MLGINDLLLLKESIDNEKVIYIYYNELNEFVFRTLGPKEYSKIKVISTSEEDFCDAICQAALIYPPDFDFSKSAMGCIATAMSNNIIQNSLIFADKEVLDIFEDSRKKTNLFLEQCILFVKSAFPEYPLEEIETWNYERLMKMTAKAEFVLMLKGTNYKIEYNKDKEKESNDINNINAPVMSDDELLEKGIDVMLYHSDEITLRQPLIEYPIIFGSNWKKEVRIRNVKQQLLGGQYSRRTLL